MALHPARRDGQAEARARVARVAAAAGDEGLEERGLDLGGDAGAVVLDAHHDGAGLARGGDGDAAAFVAVERHRGVAGEDRGHVGEGAAIDLEVERVAADDRGLDHRGAVAEDLAHVASDELERGEHLDLVDLERARPAVAQEIVEEFAGAIDLPAHGGDGLGLGSWRSRSLACAAITPSGFRISCATALARRPISARRSA